MTFQYTETQRNRKETFNAHVQTNLYCWGSYKFCHYKMKKKIKVYKVSVKYKY